MTERDAFCLPCVIGEWLQSQVEFVVRLETAVGLAGTDGAHRTLLRAQSAGAALDGLEQHLGAARVERLFEYFGKRELAGRFVVPEAVLLSPVDTDRAAAFADGLNPENEEPGDVQKHVH